MAERTLSMECFRNFGLAKDEDGFKPSVASLTLDRNFELGKAGGLVFLIGENGAGKSNALDAVNHLTWDSDPRFNSKDYTTIAWDPECQKAKITISCNLPDASNNVQTFSITKENGGLYSFSPNVETTKSLGKLTSIKHKLFSTLIKLCQIETDSFTENRYTNSRPIETGLNDILNHVICTHCKELSADFKIDLSAFVYSGSEAYKEFLKQVESQIISNLKLPIETINKIKEDIWSVIRVYMDFAHRSEPVFDQHKMMYDHFINKVFYEVGNDLRFISEDDRYSHFRRKFEKDFSIGLIGQIHKYEPKVFSGNDLNTNWSDINGSIFFTAFFKAINYDIEIVENRYLKHKQLDSYGLLKDLQDDINKKLPKVADDFNKLYNSPSRYSFEIDLGEDKIHFLIKKGNQRVVLKNEATGFIYFFNMYFGLLYNGNLKPGDIITMDEPATNLSVPAQKELHAFLKDFAIRHQVLILCATHCPFLISPDDLDELRIVSCDENGIATIDNEYSLLSKHSNATTKIKRALTIENYQIIKPDSKVVFVESMDEYNILTAFKQVLDIDGINEIYFFPIGKVDENEDVGRLLEEILRINTRNPIILLPKGPTYDRIDDHCQKDPKCKHVLVQNYGQEISSILSLFEKDSSCLSDGSYYFKNHIQNIKGSLSDETCNTFKVLFTKILEDIDE